MTCNPLRSSDECTILCQLLPHDILYTVSVVGNKGRIHLEDYMIVIAADMILQSNLEKATLALKGQSVAFQLPYHDI